MDVRPLNSPLVKEHHVIGDVSRNSHLVRNNEHCAALLGVRLHYLQHFAHKRRGLLVQQHHIWMHREGARDCDAQALLDVQQRRGHGFARQLESDIEEIDLTSRPESTARYKTT